MINKKFKLPQEKIEEIKHFEKKWTELMNNLGEMKINQLELETRELYLKQHYVDLQDMRNTLLNNLKSEYGEGFVDLDQNTYNLK
tara:strand:+ start:278 stop:532 length:255 start_codon:yes stop_codon:yes gene_type:complete